MKEQERHRERNDEIAALWLAGHKASAIAWRMGAQGVTRNVVLGVVDRRGLFKSKTRSDKHAVVNGGGDALERLERRQCHYPLGGMMDPVAAFCGAPVFMDKPYCLDHCRSCYRPVGAINGPASG